MKMSELTVKDAARFLKLFPEDLAAPGFVDELRAMLDAARAIVRETTGNDAEQCDKHPDLAIAALILTQDMFDNRTRYTKAADAGENRTLAAILGLHDRNLV